MTVVWTAVIAWSLSQVLKVIVAAVRIGKGESSRIVWRLVWAGGMPSSHSAFTTATALTIAWHDGIDSTAFGIAFVLAAIVIYDRGKLHHIYKVFQDRSPSLASQVENDPVLADLVGHTTGQIVVGVLIGAAAAGISYLLSR